MDARSFCAKRAKY